MMRKKLLYIINSFGWVISAMDTINVNGFQYFGVSMLYSLCSRDGGRGAWMAKYATWMLKVAPSK